MCRWRLWNRLLKRMAAEWLRHETSSGRGVRCWARVKKTKGFCMDWFKATRASGEKNKPGEFVVEDSAGVEWQVTAIDSKKKPGTLTLLNEVVCMNRGYECGWEMRGDIHQAVKELLDAEAAEDPEKRRERFISDMVAVCRKHRVMMQPDGGEWEGLDAHGLSFAEFNSLHSTGFNVDIDAIESAIRLDVFPVVHPE